MRYAKFAHFAALILMLAALGLGSCASEQEIRISVLHHFDKGNEAFAKDNFTSAVHHYRAALDMDPRLADIWYNLGLAYYHMADFGESVIALEEARALAPTRPEIHYNLALSYHGAYDLPSAHRSYQLYQALSGPPLQDQIAAMPAGNAAAGLAGAADAQADAPGQPAAGAPAAGAAQADAGGAPRLGRKLSQVPGALEAQENLGAQTVKQPPAQQRARMQRNQGPGQPGDDDNPFEGNAEWWKEELPRQ